MKFSDLLTRLTIPHGLLFILGAQLLSLPCHASRIVVLSDIHIKTNSDAPAGTDRAVEEALRIHPDLVVLAGDMTCGNPDDGISLGTAQSWWVSLKKALHPLEEAGIPILPIPGNHDWYTEAHREAYRRAWPTAPAGLQIEGPYPVQYRALTSDTELFFLPIVDQVAPKETVAFLRHYPPTPRLDHARLAFGHVPLASRMGRSNPSFLSSFGPELLRAGVSSYISGHEHLVWDESLSTSPAPNSLLRQLWVGTASGSYTFPLRQSVYDSHCKPTSTSASTTLCVMPETQKSFRVRTSDRSEVLQQTFAILLTGKDRKAPMAGNNVPEVELRGWDATSKKWVDFYEK